jgi:hypothetical protein
VNKSALNWTRVCQLHCKNIIARNLKYTDLMRNLTCKRAITTGDVSNNKEIGGKLISREFFGGKILAGKIGLFHENK